MTGLNAGANYAPNLNAGDDSAAEAFTFRMDMLLPAFAEHAGFALAHLIASAATGLVLTIYAGLVSAGISRVLRFVILTGILFGTHKLDWSGPKVAGGQPPAGPMVPSPAG